MIELEIKDALTILKLLSQVEGFLLSVDGNRGHAADLLDFPCELLIKKLAESKNDSD